MFGNQRSHLGINDASPQPYSNAVGLVDATEMEYWVKEPWRSTTGGSATGRGSGWFFDHENRKLFVTCFHCVSDSIENNGIFVSTAAGKGKKSAAKVLAILPGIDAAILSVEPLEGMPYDAFRMGDDTDLRTEETLRVYGYPGGQSNLKVVASTLNGRQDGALQLDGAINEGHSGGPVVSDRTGAVVGWVYSGVPLANSMAYAKPICYLRAILSCVDFESSTLFGVQTPLLKSVTQRKHTQIIRPKTPGIDTINANDTLFRATGAPAQTTGVIVQWISEISALHRQIKTGDALCFVRVNLTKSFSYLGAESRLLRFARGSTNDTFTFWVQNDGQVSVPWASNDMYSLEDLYPYLSPEVPIEFGIWSVKKTVMKVVEVELRDCARAGTRDIYRPFEVPEYECFSGLVVVELDGTVAENVSGQVDSLSRTQKERPALVIVNILPGSEHVLAGEGQAPLHKGDILERVNGIKVRTIDEYREALMNPINDRYFYIEAKENRFELLDLQKVVDIEPSLVQTYGYPSLFVSEKNDNDSDTEIESDSNTTITVSTRSRDSESDSYTASNSDSDANSDVGNRKKKVDCQSR
jgi:S1-C subfamily serine protease